MAQDRDIQNVLKSLNKKPSELDKRLAYLEKAEYSRLNYYASIMLTIASWVDTTAGAVIIPGMTEKFLKGFTLSGSALTCVQPGIYYINYSVTIFCGGVLYATGAVTVNGVAELGSRSDGTGILGDYFTLCSPTIVSLDVGDVVRLVVDSTPNTLLVATASLTLTRVDDN